MRVRFFNPNQAMLRSLAIHEYLARTSEVSAFGDRGGLEGHERLEDGFQNQPHSKPFVGIPVDVLRSYSIQLFSKPVGSKKSAEPQITFGIGVLAIVDSTERTEVGISTVVHACRIRMFRRRPRWLSLQDSLSCPFRNTLKNFIAAQTTPATANTTAYSVSGIHVI